MAYSCVRVTFEIGHEASLRTKRTPEGFTHDWEVFVRGADNTEINHFVEKIVFYLHETFTKPRRVVREPPYSVKESGYAGFTLPIEIYFRTEDEPKKVRFNYDLDLQPSGPTINKVQREKYVFRNPDEDLRRRLIRGGGVGVGSDVSSHSTPGEKPTSTSTITSSTDETPAVKSSVPPLVGKPKLGGDPVKKHKIKEYRSEEPRVSNAFHDLFGPPIKTAKVSPDPKKPSSSPKVSPLPKPAKPPDKPSNDKQISGAKPSKHSVQKDSRDSSSSSSKEEKKDRSKDREKNKEKSKHSTPPPKRPPTPPKCPPPSKPAKEEPKKVQIEDSKGKSETKSSGESSKSEKKKKDKKSKDEKSKKDRHKEHDSKSNDKSDKNEKSAKESKDKEKEAARKPEKELSKEPDKSKEKEKSSIDGDKEHAKHKHKKKERSRRDESGKERERDREKGTKKSSTDSKKSGESKDRDRNGIQTDANKKRPRSPSLSPPSNPSLSPIKPSPSPDKLATPSTPKDKPIKRPLTRLLDELTKDQDSSDSNLSQFSGDDDSIELPSSHLTKHSTPVENKKLETTQPDITSESVVTSTNTQSSSKLEATKSKPESANQERNSLTKVSSSKQKDKSASKKSKEKKEGSGSVGKENSGSKGDRDPGKKRKRKGKDEEGSGEGKAEGATTPKLSKLEPEMNRPDDSAGRVTSETQAEVSTTTDSTNGVQSVEVFAVPVAAPPVPAAPVQFSADYVSQLKDLQHKIMTLEDNAELQRVVQVIAETGQYEITKKTFDFDLCALDRSTVKRLQDFFTTS